MLPQQKGWLSRPTHPSLKAFISEETPGRACLVLKEQVSQLYYKGEWQSLKLKSSSFEALQ